MNNINDYNHIIEIDTTALNKDSINKNFDKLLDDSPLSGLNSHYLDTENKKVYLSFNHFSSKPDARIKTILKGFGVNSANHIKFNNSTKMEIAEGKISLKNKVNFNLTKGISKREIIESKLKTYMVIKDNPNEKFNQIRNKLDTISNKSNQIENTIFHNPETIKNLSDFNKIKLNHFINQPPEQVKTENLNKLKEAFQPFEILNNQTVIQEIGKGNIKNIENMVAFGYKAPEKLINNISQTQELSTDKKTALINLLDKGKIMSKDKNLIKEKSFDKNLTKDKSNEVKTTKDKGMSM